VLLGLLLLLPVEVAVALVDQCKCVLPVVPDGHVSLVLGLLLVLLEQLNERYVGGCPSTQTLVFQFEAFQDIDRVFEVLVFEVHESLAHLEFSFSFGDVLGLG